MLGREELVFLKCLAAKVLSDLISLKGSKAFRSKNVACGYDVVVMLCLKVDTDAILYGDAQCKKMDISVLSGVFSAILVGIS